MSKIGISEGNLVATFEAGEDLSAKQFFGVKMATDKAIDLCDAATDFPLGILLNKPSTGEAAEILLNGVGKAKVGGTVQPGDLLGPDTDGMLIKVTADTKTYCAMALADGEDGDIVDVRVLPVGHIAG